MIVNQRAYESARRIYEQRSKWICELWIKANIHVLKCTATANIEMFFQCNTMFGSHMVVSVWWFIFAFVCMRRFWLCFFSSSPFFFLCILFSFFHFIMMCVCVFFLLSTIECWSLTCSYAYCGFIPRTVKPERCMISFVYFICLCFCFRLLYAVKIRLTSTEMAPYRSKWIPSKNISNEQKELWI